MQRNLQDLHVDLENTRKTAQQSGKPAEERLAATLMIDIQEGLTVKLQMRQISGTVTASVTRVLCASLTRITCERARAMVRDGESTRNGAWASANLRQRCGNTTRATCFNKVFQYNSPNQKNMWRMSGVTG